jgi:hypothetical protein
MDRLLEHGSRDQGPALAFRRWVEAAGERFVAELEAAVEPAGVFAVPTYRPPGNNQHDEGAPAGSFEAGVFR